VVVAGLLALMRVGVWAWFQSDAGQRYVLKRLRGALAPAGVELDVGHLAGSMVTNLRLEDVTVRACAAGVRVRARRLTIRYPLASLLRGRPRVDVAAEAPLVDGLPRRACGKAARRARGPLPPVEVRRIRIDRGTIAFAGAPRVAVSGMVTPKQVDLDLAASGTAPAPLDGPLRAHVHVDGPPTAIRLAGEIRPGRGRVGVFGRVDTRRGTASLELTPKGVTLTPARGEAQLVASGKAHLTAVRRARGRIVLDIRGEGGYRRRVIDPELHADEEDATMDRFAEESRGTWSARLRGRAGPRGLRGHFVVDLHDGPRRAAVVKGTLAAPRGGHPRFRAQILSGGPRHLE